MFSWGNILTAMNMVDRQRAGGIIWKTLFLIGEVGIRCENA